MWNRKNLFRLLLLLGVSVLVTILIAPNLNLVPARYKEGDIIPQDIVISDNVTLKDERSTDLRRQEALADFPPVYDFDPRLKASTIDAVRTAFKQARDALSEQSRARTDSVERIRQNSKERLTALAQRKDSQVRLQRLGFEKGLLVSEIGQLSEVATPDEKQLDRLQKARFDLLTIDAQIAGAEQDGAQLKARSEQLEKAAVELQAAQQRIVASESQALQVMKAEFEKTLRTTVEEATFAVLRDAQFNPELERAVVLLLSPALEARIVTAKETLAGQRNVIQVQNLGTGQLERFEALDTVVDVPGVRANVNRRGQEMEIAASRSVARTREAVIALAQRLVRPTLTENKGETERLKGELRESVSPVFFNMKKGTVVAKAGDVATAQQVEIIKALNAYNLSNPKYPQIIGTFLIVLLSLALVYQLINRRTVRVGPKGMPRMILLALLMLVTLALAQLLLWIVPPLTTVYDFIPARSFNFLIPAALTAMLGGILMGFEVGVYLGFAVALYVAILLGNSLPVFIFAMMGSVVAAIPMRHFETRSAIWEQGLRVSAINVPVLLVLALLEQAPLSWTLALDVGMGIANGLLVSLLTSTLLPLVERLFDITTNLRLLELSNMNNPALKELAVRAPGTYHHSIVVGNLSESVAEAVKANPLLVRVASLYHDLGKMMCPLYFVENQHQRNYHEDLPAKTSARIIINHVKDGIELAKRYRLGKAITDIIAQHHGDSIVRFFFHKAQEEQADVPSPLDKDDFHYAGPKPQTKEAGVVMLADVTEAAIRSLDDPSPDTIREMVQKLATRVYMEGQLDQSGMTFNDLNYIEKSFTKLLLSIHHHRISYPELKVLGDGKSDPHDESGADSAELAARKVSGS
ncbi:MAG: HDIG domain-containing protein [Candidatus Lambdaproteobacteria bacterium]|nr:HDIG domain-containing protein [Candidatus Lambdaproteobacteria bacterium]